MGLASEYKWSGRMEQTIYNAGCNSGRPVWRLMRTRGRWSSAPPPPTFPGMPPPMSPPSFMGVTLSPVVAATNMKWAKGGVFVNVPTGSGVIPSLGVEGGDGPFVLVGSAFIFSGP